jgi:hypothetical protein
VDPAVRPQDIANHSSPPLHPISLCNSNPQTAIVSMALGSSPLFIDRKSNAMIGHNQAKINMRDTYP